MNILLERRMVPEGYDSILTKNQWKALLDFVKAVDAKLLVSMSNCDGIHAAVELDKLEFNSQ